MLVRHTLPWTSHFPSSLFEIISLNCRGWPWWLIQASLKLCNYPVSTCTTRTGWDVYILNLFCLLLSYVYMILVRVLCMACVWYIVYVCEVYRGVCANICRLVHVVHVWWSEDNFSLWTVGSEAWTQVVRPLWQALLLLEPSCKPPSLPENCAALKQNRRSSLTLYFLSLQKSSVLSP